MWLSLLVRVSPNYYVLEPQNKISCVYFFYIYNDFHTCVLTSWCNIILKIMMKNQNTGYCGWSVYYSLSISRRKDPLITYKLMIWKIHTYKKHSLLYAFENYHGWFYDVTMIILSLQIHHIKNDTMQQKESY